MSYVKNTWVDGDVITSELLNHIEDGIANCGSGTGNLVLSVNGVSSNGSGGVNPLRSTKAASGSPSVSPTLNVTYNEMMSVVRNGGRLVAIGETSGSAVNFITQYYMDSAAEATGNPAWMPFNISTGGVSPIKELKGGSSELGSYPYLQDGYYIGADYIMTAYMQQNSSDGGGDLSPKSSTKLAAETSIYSIEEPTYYFVSDTPNGVMQLVDAEDVAGEDPSQPSE